MAKANEKTDAILLLKADHRNVEEMFNQFEKATRKDHKQKLASQICAALCVHATIEEEIFYPACSGKIDENVSREAYVEHDGAKVLIAEIAASDPSDKFYDARVKVLSEMIKHHVKEEEQRDGLFAQAKQAGLEMEEIGGTLSARKAELEKEIESKGLGVLMTRTMRGAKLKYSAPVIK
jgi:hemerythrin superfamily protein